MEVDGEADAAPAGLAPPLKRKKTVTWAEDDELELPLGPPGGPADGGATAGAAAAPVVVLPCDGLYDALTADLLDQQEELPTAAGEEPISRRQLLERRLAHTDQLASLYESELWALAEELRLRHTQFVEQRGERAVWKGGGGGDDAGTPAGSEGQQQQQRSDEDTDMADAEADDQAAQQQQDGSAAKPAAAGKEAAAPGTALRALWEERHQQVAGPEAQQDVKHPQQGAGRQQAEGKPEGKASKKGDKGAAASDKAAAKRGGQAGGNEGGGKAAKAEGKHAAAKDKQAAGAEHGSKQAAKQTAASKQALPTAAAGDSPGQQPAAAAQPCQEGGAAAASPAQPAVPAVPLPPLPPQPQFEDIEALVLSGAAAGLPPVDEATLVEARARFVRRLDLLGRLEQSALSAAARQLDSLGGLALLCGRRCRYILRRSAVAIGRSSGSQGKVDVDLAHEGGAAAQRVSRHQAQLWLEPDGGFRLRCTGRRPMWVNGQRLEQGRAAALPTLSHVAVGGVSLLFVANVAAAQRGTARAAVLLAP